MKKTTSWEKSHKWYGKKVGEKGHYYHQNLILPALIPLLALTKDSSLIDFGCGQGILERSIPKECKYLGLDLSSSLVKEADKRKVSKKHHFQVADLTKSYEVKESFTHGCFLLSLQNMDSFADAILQASSKIKEGGKLVFVVNHPCFRVPRQSSWETDEQKKLQYRRVDTYRSFLKIPIQMHPGSKKEQMTYSFHFNLEDFSKALQKADLLMESITELYSPKLSSGKNAKAENRARKEFPLFMVISTLHFPKKKKELNSKVKQ